MYSSIKEQKLLNVPIAKPLLIVVLSGHKALGVNNEVICQSGEFIFLSDSPSINMRNIPKDNEYFALIIEFDHQDFEGLQTNTRHKKAYHVGKTTEQLTQCLQQLVEFSKWAPKQAWSSRKREILSLLAYMGHSSILSLLGNPQIKDQLHDMFTAEECNTLTIDDACKRLAMSESTLRRKLKSEGTSVQEIKDKSRLGLALHLLQTTQHSIGSVADKCGYQSQSRFTDRFKKHFGLTPTELRKTKMAE